MRAFAVLDGLRLEQRVGRRYSASSGFKSGGLCVSWTYPLDQRWAVNATAGLNTLFGDARDSLVSERSTNYFGGVGLTYPF